MLQVIKMDKILEDTYLFDFYGELLTEHQRSIYRDIVLEDLSLGEAADEYNVSRQAIYDIVKRCRKTLLGYEDKLHLINRFLKIRELTGEIIQISEKLEESGSEDSEIGKIRELATLITEEL